MSKPDPILEAAYKRAGIRIQVGSAPVAPVDPPAAGDPQGLTEAEIERFSLARAGIPSHAE